MPGMDGVELYRRIRQLRPDVVGVFVTGFPTIDTVYPAIAVGVERDCQAGGLQRTNPSH